MVHDETRDAAPEPTGPGRTGPDLAALDRAGSVPSAETVPPEDQRRALADLLLRLSQKMGMAVHAASGAVGLTPMQARVLDGLDEDVPLPMGEISRSLSCDLSNTTGLVDRLEQRGLLRRVAAAHDRRVRAVVPTEEGRAARRRLDDALRVHNPLFLGLSAERCAEAVRVLSDLLDAHDAAPGAQRHHRPPGPLPDPAPSPPTGSPGPRR